MLAVMAPVSAHLLASLATGVFKLPLPKLEDKHAKVQV